MPRRRVLTDAQLESLLALPRTEHDLIRHWTLNEADLAAIARRRGGGNRLGYALQLCTFRYPGRLLRPGEILPQPALDFVAGQIHVTAGELATYATRRQTRQEQLDELRETFGFHMYGADRAREVSAWLLPVALATTDIPGIAATLMDEFRRRRIVAPGPTVIERLIAAVLVSAERHVTEELTRRLSHRQTEALDGLLMSDEGAATSVLAWAKLARGHATRSVVGWTAEGRHPPGAPNHKALKRTVDQLIRLREVGLDPACADGVHPERLRKLARERGRFTAQHLRSLSLPRRRATLVATVLDTVTRLTDDAVGLFDRAVGRMVRRAEAREDGAVLRDAKAVGDKVRLLVRLGAALIAAKKEKADLDAAVTSAVGWDRLAASITEAERLSRPEKVDLNALAGRSWPVLHRLGPIFLAAFRLRAIPAALPRSGQPRR